MKKSITAVLIAAALMMIPVTTAFAAEIKLETDDASLNVAAFNEYKTADAAAIDVKAPSAILMEKETGKVVYEKNADERLEPASVTKVMTILLIVEEIDAGNISLDDMVTTSTYASSMGGSQIFLKEGETMSVRDMLKSIIVASANDAAVAMAEHICGTEGAFVARMNERARQLGMENTTFLNCTGLLNQPEHLTTARDIAIMSRELIKHDWIKEFTTIWMDTVRNGEFGLSNTNKLIYYYDGSTGLKTGFTSSAGYCLSATAMRDGVEYIAVVMNCATSQDRFESAKALLSYGFSTYTLAPVLPDQAIPPIMVEMGAVEYIQPVFDGEGKLLVEKSRVQSLTKEIKLDEKLTAPVKAGQSVGRITVSDGENVLYEADITAESDVPRLTFWQIFFNVFSSVFRGYAPYGNI